VVSPEYTYFGDRPSRRMKRLKSRSKGVDRTIMHLDMASPIVPGGGNSCAQVRRRGQEGEHDDEDESENGDRVSVVLRVFFCDFTREPLQYLIRSHFQFHL